MTKDNKRFLGFDLARVVSMIYIVLYHSLGYGNPLYSNSIIRTFAYLSLSIFTFQSGFLLASRHDLANSPFFDFIKKRLLRIYPLFVISSIILCLIGFNTWSSTAKSWVGLSPFWGPTPRTMWYVGILIYFYTFTLFWAKGGIKKQICKFALTMVVVAGIHFFFHSVDPRTIFYSFIYFAGIILGQYKSKEFFSVVSTRRFEFIILLLFISILIMQLFHKSLLFTYGNSIIGMFALFSLYINIGERWKTNQQIVSIISILSYATFCLYLFHREVFQLLLSIWHPEDMYALFMYVGVLGLMITFPLAYIIQKGYDKMIQKNRT